MRTWAFLSALRRAVAGGRLVGRGFRLERARRLAEAREAFRRAREAAGPAAAGPLEGALDSVRLTATMRLACLEAALGEDAGAVALAREGLALCAAARLSSRGVRDLAFLRDWEIWARQYLSTRA
ncbi:MAG TPA: hypothetical protein VLS93_17495 [Anaeromyxobacteraceae bacterium]|nr:hypothetical protein [Anaeromyxobacteraceae bacterium]